MFGRSISYVDMFGEGQLRVAARILGNEVGFMGKAV